MQSLLNALRSVLGEPNFYLDGVSGTYNYGLMFEYIFAGILLLICVSSVFRFLMLLVKGK